MAQWELKRNDANNGYDSRVFASAFVRQALVAGFGAYGETTLQASSASSSSFVGTLGGGATYDFSKFLQFDYGLSRGLGGRATDWVNVLRLRCRSEQVGLCARQPDVGRKARPALAGGLDQDAPSRREAHGERAAAVQLQREQAAARLRAATLTLAPGRRPCSSAKCRNSPDCSVMRTMRCVLATTHVASVA